MLRPAFEAETTPRAAPGLYVSFPFCRQKCTYCNFASGVFSQDLRRRYVTALAAEAAASDTLDRADTLYLGGGTPSLLTGEELDEILGGRRREWAEATVEAAPGDVTEEAARLWRERGIDRVSLGVQSFDRRVAAAAGRKHSAEQVEQEISILRRAGVERISVDLIAGLAHQKEADWEESLDWIERLEVEHASVYMLDADDDSRLGAEIRSEGGRYGARDVPSDDQTADFYERAIERLAAMGLEHYEISNFARPGCESAHNLKYWTFAPYVGVGSDAHSFDGAERWNNARMASEYVARWERGELAAAERETLDAVRRRQDRLLTGLRLRAGAPLEPGDLDGREEALEQLLQKGWVERPEPQRLRLTSSGVLFANEVFLELLFE
ncbi:MAG: radical SAM family heme chaperone HemW [Acidobacteria bacterium]|nr:radical SAM family heme chaperone HemW [Acidobacteriota bacterium]